MAAINSLLFLLTTLSPLSEYVDFTTTPSVDTAWISGESFAPDYKCPAGEVYGACIAHCQKNCTNYDRPIPCPRICVNGCVCPIGQIRGPNNRCITPDQCSEGRKCPVGEVYDKCGARCQRNCSNKDQDLICPLICAPGCICEKGKIRGPNNRCIDPNQCRGRYCPKGEIFEECKAHCQKNCTNKDQEVPCPRICRSGCICPAGKVRGPDNRCIVPEKCSQREEWCPANERFDECEAGCQKDCTNYDRPVICPRMCIPGCVCPEGQVRGADKRCIIPEKCSWNNEIEQRQGDERCPAGEVYSECYAHCQKNCTNFDHPFPCLRICFPGCVCPEGQVRGEDNRCVMPEQCSSNNDDRRREQLCPAGEIYDSCSAACQKNCYNKDHHIPCPHICSSGCICPKGKIRRGPNKECIELDQCPAHNDIDVEVETVAAKEGPSPKCNQTQVFKNCSSYCPDSCRNRNSPDRKCKKICIPGCECKPGLIFSPEGKCINPKTCPSDKTPAGCGKKEKFLKCGSACPDDCSNFFEENRPCTKQCVMGCFCESGYVRGPRGDCIWPTACPWNPNSHLFMGPPSLKKTDEESRESRSRESSPESAEETDVPFNLHERRPCPIIDCRPGYHLDNNAKPCPRCVRDNVLQRRPCPLIGCEPGYHLDTTEKPCPRHCVPDNVLQNTHSGCKENEEYLTCGSACPDDCFNFSEENRPCTSQCVQGCFCVSGYVKGPNGKCILPTQCRWKPGMPCPIIDCKRGYHLDTTEKPCPRHCVPDNVLQNTHSRCNENEVYLTCGSACPDDCFNYSEENRPCTDQCVQGCFCKKGYVLGTNRKCILPTQCRWKPGRPCPIIDCIRGYHLDTTEKPCPRHCVPDNVPPTKKCGRNEKWSDCVIPCNDCQIRGLCNFLICNPGCDCKDGYYREDRTRMCIPEHQCPPNDRPCPQIRCKEGCHLDNDAKPCPRCRCNYEQEDEDSVEEMTEDNSLLLRRMFSESEEDKDVHRIL